jgi:hypothetical protein
MQASFPMIVGLRAQAGALRMEDIRAPLSQASFWLSMFRAKICRKVGETIRYTCAVTLTFKAIPTVQPQKINLGGVDDCGLQIIIWSASEPQARSLDDALNPLLIEYGYDVLSGRREFRGSFFIRYKSSKKTPELERDFELFFGRDPKNPTQPGAQQPSDNPEKWKKLKEVLESTKAFLVVGTLLVGTLGALYEFSEQVHKTFGHTPTLSRPSTQTDKRLQKIPIQPSLIRIDAQKNPRQFERLLNSEVEKYLVPRGLLKKKQPQSESHLDNTN